jgi:hypothetical protein
MRTLLLTIMIAVFSASMAPAEPSNRQKPSGQSTDPDRPLLPTKSAGQNSCAAYGAGFVRVDGTQTCVKIGGAVGVEAGSSRGSR